MYDELVKHLREISGNRAIPVHMAETAKEAADSIEDLEFACNRYEKDYKALCEYLPKWIPVTERLPEDGRFLALTTPYISSSEPVARILRFSKNLESVNRYDFEGINRSGWYFFDDEYGYIEVDDVTHWMPLPDPPKEATPSV